MSEQADRVSAPSVPGHRYTAELAREIESRWQGAWERGDVYRAPNPGEEGFDPAASKRYVLDMFPYPSGAGLHVGHPLGYIATDIVARFARMRGENVLHAMGFDAFGLPAEQYAIETGTHPRVTTERNIARFRGQMRRLGLGHEARRSVSTTDPSFYKWTQWIFLRLFNSWFDPAAGRARPIAELVGELERGERTTGDQDKAWSRMTGGERDAFLAKHRLAYLDDVDVNWCPALGTVLANEEVTADGRSERGNHPVIKRPLRQWMMRITAYAERLLDDLSLLDWPEPIKAMQRNWIGRSEGAYVDFDAGKRRIRVFTTRPDTLYGATYMVLAPEHPLVDELVGEGWGATVPEAWKGSFPGADGLRERGAGPRETVEAYRAHACGRSSVERQQDAREKTGVFIGAYAVNPAGGERVPIFIADYVLMEYGTGAIMAVPAHDQRDFDFAKRFELPIRDVVYPRLVLAMKYFSEHAVAEERRDENWAGMLADFLGVVTSSDESPERFGEAMTRTRVQREELEDVASSCPVDFGVVSCDLPGSLGDRRGATRVVWLDVLSDLGVDSLDCLRSRFERASFYAEVGHAQEGPGYAANSEAIEGMATAEAKPAMSAWLAEHGRGGGTVTYKLRDWLFSRQRYWGEPFPIVYEEGDEGHERPIGLPESRLPVELPEIDDFRPVGSDDPTEAPKPPLGRAEEWAHLRADLGEGEKEYERELNTMPQWAGSCWYYLRYLDPENDERFCDPEVERYWMGEGPGGGVDLYVGGAEHAVLHLLYARFWHKVLHDLGEVSTPEPFRKLFNQGYIQAPAFTDARGVYVDASSVEERDGGFFFGGEPVTREFGKMGKSLKNVVTPDEVCDEYGADAMRLYEMYMGPLEQSKPWNPRDIVGVFRFLQRVWRNLIDEETGEPRVSEGAADEGLRRALHKTIAQVRGDYERMSFNTAIARLIELNNQLGKAGAVPREAARALVLMLAPMAPHVCEELWSRLGEGGSVVRAPFPEADESLLVEDEVELPVQVSGKVRGRIRVAADADEEALKEAAREAVAAHLEGKTVRKIVVVPGRMVSIVAN